MDNLLENQYLGGYEQGLQEGLRVANLIFLLYKNNHRLKEPYSQEQLDEWAGEDIDGLKKRIADVVAKQIKNMRNEYV